MSFRQNSFNASSPLDSPNPAAYPFDLRDSDTPPAYAFYNEARPGSPLPSDAYPVPTSVPNFFPPRKDRAKRYGRRFALPVPFLQGPDAEVGMFRQSSAPSLGVEFRADDADLGMLPPAVPAVPGAVYPQQKRFSTPVYPSDLSAIDAAASAMSSGVSSGVPNGVSNGMSNAAANGVANAAAETSAEKTLPPGENNPHAYLGANLCFDYLNKG